MERDSAEASLLAEVIAAEAEADAVRHDVAFYRGAEDVERQLGRVASVLDTLHATASRYRPPSHWRTHRVGWRGGAASKAFGLAISRSRVRILLEATLRNNLRQVVYTYAPLSPSSITWYRPKGGDALRLGR